ncbi:MAG: hypothetical protein Q8N18_00575 [Opitutaceae bacterium]|nr:hypothetical protein [Opitutaceae bacterium]
MQLANSTTPPTDPNLLALMFCGATTTSPAGLPAAPSGEAGFAALLSGFSPAGGESFDPETALLDMGLGVPFAYLGLSSKGAIESGGPNPEAGEGAISLPANPHGEEPSVGWQAKPVNTQPKRGVRGPAVASRLNVSESPAKLLPADGQGKAGEVTPPFLPEAVAFVAASVVDLSEDVIEAEAVAPEDAFSPGTEDESQAGAQPEVRLHNNRAPNPERTPLHGHSVAPDAGLKNEQERPADRGDRVPLAEDLPEVSVPVGGYKPFEKDPSQLQSQQPGMPRPTDLHERSVEHRVRLDLQQLSRSQIDQEKNAAISEELADERARDIATPEKKLLSDVNELVANHRRALGIGVANSAPTMPASNYYPPSQTPAHDVASSLVAAPGGLAERIESHNVLGLQLDGVSSAHEAVEVVLRTADRLSSLVHKSVRLEFSVGGEALDVRVELRSNEVRTTFHTESAELRTALASEWQAVSASAGSGDRTLRILPAQFGSSESGSDGFSGDSSQRHRDAHAQAQAEAAHSFSFGGRGRSSRSNRGAAVVPPVTAAFAAPGTALHLHTLA